MSAVPQHPPLIVRHGGIAVPLLNPRDDAARLIAAMIGERQPLTLTALAPRAAIPVAEARRAIDRLAQMQMVDGDHTTGWILRHAAAESAPTLTVSARALAYLRDDIGMWTSTRDIEHAIDAGNSQILGALNHLLDLGEVERRPGRPRGYEWRVAP